MKLKIGNKEYDASVTIGKFEKLENRYTTVNITDEDGKESTLTTKNNGGKVNNYEYALYTIWLYLNRRWYGLKPFVFKRFMKNAITFQEYLQADKVLAEAYRLEDKEGGN